MIIELGWCCMMLGMSFYKWRKCRNDLRKMNKGRGRVLGHHALGHGAWQPLFLLLGRHHPHQGGMAGGVVDTASTIVPLRPLPRGVVLQNSFVTLFFVEMR